MPRNLVGPLAAIGAAMSVVASLAHGDLFWAVVMTVAAATGLAAYLAIPPTKKRPTSTASSHALAQSNLQCSLPGHDACCRSHIPRVGALHARAIRVAVIR